ncbi:hypothetical protein [Salipaludibacillus sp. CF4.18]|uniref:hypothetical protein n=1 Tax=Salipaludibacillus sp. CF4.18 TaxID=3373081 RepID=UPI003EE4E01F
MSTHKDMRQHCEEHMHRYVQVTTNDNRSFDGIVECVDEENLYLAVPNGGGEIAGGPHDSAGQGFGYGYFDQADERQFFPGYGGYGYPYYTPYPQPYYPYYRPRRFQRLILPLAALTALSVLPYYW